MYDLKQLATLLGGEIKGDETQKITGIAPFSSAKKGEITFAAEPKILKNIENTAASVLVVPRLSSYLLNKTYIVVENNLRELMPVLFKYFKKKIVPFENPIENSAIIGENVKIGPNTYIGHSAQIGNNTIIYPNVYIGENSKIGENSIIYPGVIIREFCEIGNNCILQPGAIIGADGFGYVKVKGINSKIEQIGRVILEDNVEIGANTTVDRGAIGDTHINKNSKIDNLVQIGHNVKIGENCLIIAQVAIAGSTEIGNNCTIAGQTGIAGHIKIGDNVQIGGQSAVTKDVAPNQTICGRPIVDIKKHFKISASLKKLPEMIKVVKNLEKIHIKK